MIDLSQGQPPLYAAGAKCDGLTNSPGTDDGPAFTTYQNLFGGLSYGGGGVLRLPPNAVCRIGTSVSVGAHVTFEGPTSLPMVEVPADWARVAGLSVDGTATLNMSENAALRRLFIKRTGITFPIANSSAFAGQPITFGDPYAQRVEDVTVIGFGTCLGQSSALPYNNDWMIKGFKGDCNTGISLSKPSYASAVLRDIDLSAFASIFPATDASYQRTGTGLDVSSNLDGGLIDNVFSSGHPLNFHINSGNVMLRALWAEMVSQDGTISITGTNFVFDTNAISIHATGPIISFGNYNGVIVNSLDGSGLGRNTLNFPDLQIEKTLGPGLVVQNGNVLSGGYIANQVGTYPVSVSNASSYVFIRGRAVGSGGTADLCAPVGGDSNLLDVKFATNRPAGATQVACNAIGPTAITSAASLVLPAFGDAFVVNGTTAFTSVTAQNNPRDITLQFTAAMSLTTGGNIVLASPYTSNNGSFLKLRYNTATNQWRETGRSA